MGSLLVLAAFLLSPAPARAAITLSGLTPTFASIVGGTVITFTPTGSSFMGLTATIDGVLVTLLANASGPTPFDILLSACKAT